MSFDALMPLVQFSISIRRVDTRHVRDKVHQTGKYLLLLFPKADQMLSVRQHMLSLTDRCAVILPPNTPYMFSFGTVCEYYRISFLPLDEDTGSILQEMTHKYQQLITDEGGIETESLFTTVQQLYDLSNDRQHTEIQFASTYRLLLMYKLVMDIRFCQQSRRHTSISITRNDLVESIVRYLEDNYTSRVTLDQISQQFYHSKYHISRKFYAVTGRHITDFLNMLRIKRACVELTETTKDITDICFESGFYNLQHFYSVFKAQTGLTPHRYRKQFS